MPARREGFALRLQGIRKSYGHVVAADGIDLEVREGEFFTLLGPSGSGKTTLLRLIAGFERPDAGRIELGGRDVTTLPPNGALKMVRLEGLENRRPNQLSGGQRQRVALARAVVNEPEVLLLDEPLGALDLKLRQEMQIELKNIQKEVGITFVYVTHDQEEALTMSDRMAVMAGGRIQQVGPPIEVYERPVNEFVAGFIGISNVLDRDGWRLVIRPEKLILLEEGEPAEPGMSVEAGVVEQVVYVGMITRFTVRIDRGESLVAVRQNMDAPGRTQGFEGRRVRLAWSPDHAYVLERATTGEEK